MPSPPFRLQAKGRGGRRVLSNFQEERWKGRGRHQGRARAAGAEVHLPPTQGSNEKQLADVEALIAKGAKARSSSLAMDADAIRPGGNQGQGEAKIPVVAYDRLIQDKDALPHLRQRRGRPHAGARGAEGPPKGNYVFIKGSPTDPNADFLNGGQREVLKAAMDRGDIKIVGEQYTDGWAPENAQKNMEQILTKNANKVDAVVASTTARPAAWWPR